MKHECCICKEKKDRSRRIKNGWICVDCFEELPVSFQKNAELFGHSDLYRIAHTFFKCNNPADEPGVRFRYRNTATGNVSLALTLTDIIVNSFIINYKYLKSVDLKFHPVKVKDRDSQIVTGHLCLQMELISPSIIMEEDIGVEDLKYEFADGCATYTYPKLLAMLIGGVRTSLLKGTHNMFNVFEEFYKYRQKEKEKKEKEEEEQRREERRQKEEYARKKREEKLTEYEKAKIMYEVTEPFTKDVLTKKRNILSKKFHPDNGGTNEQMALVLNYYNILCKFAAS